MVVVHFGTNGWHGRFSDSCTLQATYSVARTLAAALVARGLMRVLVGFDTREQSRLRAELVAATLLTCGVRPSIMDSFHTTPAISWLCAHGNYDCAVILTGGDYAASYGGMVLRGGDGGLIDQSIVLELDGEIEQEIPQDIYALVENAAQGLYERIDRVHDTSAYTNAVLQFDSELAGLVGSAAGSAAASNIASASSPVDPTVSAAQPTKAPLRVVVDSMHGATSASAPRVIEAIGCSVMPLRQSPLQDFGGVHPRPIKPWTNPAYRALQEYQAAAAISFDGDGMRMSLVDSEGHHVPLHIIGPCILDYLVAHCHKTGRVVTTQASSVRLSRYAQRLGLEVTCVPVGFNRIYDEICEGDVLLACDEYGGVCVPAFARERDALLAALLFMRFMQLQTAPLHQIVQHYTDMLGHMDYTRKDIELNPAAMQTFTTMLPGLNPAQVAGAKPVDVSHADGLRLGFADGSWILLRPSRTEMRVRIYAEAPSLGRRQELLRAACDIAQSQL